ncbi:MAG: hypothetical protein AAGI01_09360 [Myxococcota bacterium]
MKSMLRMILTLLVALTLIPSCKPEASKDTKGGDTEVEKADDTTKGGSLEDKASAAKGAEVADKADANPAGDDGGRVEQTEDGGQWVISTAYGVKFRVPDDWETQIEPDGASATDSDDTTTVVLVGTKSEGLIQAALQEVQKKVKFKDMKLEGAKDVVHNGLPGKEVRGTAVLVKEEEGVDQEIQFIAYNLQIDTGSRAVTLMIFSEAEMYEAKREIIEGLAQTLVKVKA